jgi:hypothetical protein
MLAPDITEQIEAINERLVEPGLVPSHPSGGRGGAELGSRADQGRDAEPHYSRSILSGAVATGLGLACCLQDHPQ